MANTVIAIFEEAEQAQTAQGHLLTHGFSQVNIKTASYKSEASNAEEKEQDLIDSITTFFRDLFGADHQDITHYAEAGRHRTIVTVHTDTSEEAEQVAGILDENGAIDVNETSGSYFPENDESTTQHQFLDDSVHNPAQNHSFEENSEDRTRVNRIKSRIIQRSIDKGSFSAES
ncbi:hypothetical protein [Dyadobacter sp. NIV53]|uniref:hypothetical protein n=1 Tax=Dyadobacter sp. NIV53 TaxID=2861765 RepID=UPI001C87EDD7|nr:hypothetical protein [Dyadobacter sp. NIV53]